MPRTSTLLGLAIAGYLSLSSPALFAQTAPINQSPQAQLDGAGNAAKRDFNQFVQYQVQNHAGSAPQGFPLDVADVQDLKDARIAYGFPVYTIDPADLLTGRRELKAMARPTGIWRFVITLNDQPIGLATVEQVNGKWETVAYGATVMAKDLDAAMGAYANADRSNVRVLRIYQAQSDFLEVSSAQNGAARFAPLHSARQSLLLQRKGTGDGLLDASELLEPLRIAVKKNLESTR
ncbi:MULTISPECIES: hypothetical protein [unclassified Duganella]|uniref:hypothetical protein n=1 Tax=unclassified Duganella TaxID=2636909 RepID=UPI000E34D0F1|nr:MULTISPECIES: hypothetical protein [unclassified Duganella]RFP07957.1 hypothetical protein D0T23_31140 [Duganella sp. BJB475]RFP21467.1 hypothetical protein D0T21_31295 [Duganella sp. BJB476]